MNGTHRSQSGPSASGAEDSLNDFWANRPRRPRRGRKIAGVAAGIGHRYGIDPVLVRVAFLVGALYGGAGIVLYLLGWLLLPEESDETSPLESLVGRGRSSTSAIFTLLLCGLLIPAFGWVFDGFFPGYIGLIVCAGALYLLHRNRSHVRQVAAQPVASPMPADTFATTAPRPQPSTVDTPADGTRELPVEERTTPPAWDPLGAAPFAWDLPEPSQPPVEEPPEPAQQRSKIGMMTIAALLIVGGGAALMTLVSPGTSGWFTPPHIVGVSLAVIGLGLVGGAFVRGGRGLIGLAVPLSMVGILMTASDFDGQGGVGDITEAPTTIDAVQSSYERSVGSVSLDLTRLPAIGDVNTRVDVDAGDATVILPKNADVDLKCETDVGEVTCLDRTINGLGGQLKVNNDGDDGPGGLKIDLTVKTDVGSVEVRRG
ncbi:PspC domain-containing protein [Herbihabitans rhizosphaerae]|uniref:PspC domain-containing protein n=1 Tax=Herbihabitans rhizosphaerae TaxID=1872711 RepID=UPI001F5E60E9|nr:PspC domain-containing protein [Herbihabitans rhizosphaerae]